MTDLLTVAEAQIAEKQVKEIEAIKKRLDADREVLKKAIELVNTHTLYRKVQVNYYGVYRYELVTEEILRNDYLGEPDKYAYKGIQFHYDSWKEKYNRGIITVNGHDYYDIRYVLQKYEDSIKDKQRKVDDLNSNIRDLKEELDALHKTFPSLKQVITEWMEYQKELEDGNQEY